MKRQLVFLLITIPVMLLLTVSCNNSKSSKTDKVTAFDVSNMDTTCKPCSDFDGYANGSWKKHNPIPSTEATWGSFDILDKENREVKI